MLLVRGRTWTRHLRALQCTLLLLALSAAEAENGLHRSRTLLTGLSYGQGLLDSQSEGTNEQPQWKQFQHKEDADHGFQGRPSATTVYTIVNNNDAQFGTYVCVDACAHGNTCIWQNAWLWQCNGTNPTHHYWVWEPDTLIIRSATTDTFAQNPEICLDMCLDTRYGNGACAVTASEGVLNVGFRECTGAPNQQFEQQGLKIVNKANGYCLSAGAQSCGRWANCNKGLAQTRQNNTILNVYAEQCDSSKPSQEWTLGPAPNSTLIDFTPLNVSAARYAQPVDTLASQASNNSHQVINFVNNAGDNTCLSIENQASCQSSQDPGTNIILNGNSTVCVWKNALLQTCWTAGADAGADQQWVYDNTTKLIVLGTDPRQNVCLELCTDTSFANGACSLTPDNIGFASCTGAPNQQWTFNDGLIYNEAMDMCINEQPLCMIDYQLFLNDPAAASREVNGYPLSTCITNIKNGPWSGLPYNGTNNAPIGIRNLVGGPCDQPGNGTLTFTATPALHFVARTDPIAPGITASGPSTAAAAPSGSSSTGAIVGGVVGGVVGMIAILAVIFGVMMRRRRLADEQARMDYEEDLKKHYSGLSRKRDSIDSDVLAPARSGGLWLDKLDLGDEINPADIEIAKRPDGSEWQLGEGAFGTVYKANRFGVQPVAVKVLREDSGKHIENFKREIDMLRGLRDNNIVLFLGACKKSGRLMLVTEFMPQGDLWNALNHPTNAPKFQWYQRGRKIALDVARGMVHLHSRNIVHMDLKSPNILLGKDLTAKIADVGLARSINNSYLTQMTSIGTMAWAAPELKRNFKIGKKEGPRTVSAKADVFSFGVVVWEVVTGEDPTFSSREVRVPEECPAEIEQLIQDCLEEDPEQRPDMKTVFERLRKADAIPPPGRTVPFATPMATPPLSSDGSIKSGPKSHRNTPKSGGGDYVKRLGLAAALKSRLGGAHFSGSGLRLSGAPRSGGGAPRSSGGAPKSSGGPRSGGAPRSTMYAESIQEEAESVEDLQERDDSAEEKDSASPRRLDVVDEHHASR